MPVTSRFRLALGGLAESDRATLRHWLDSGELIAAPQWNVTDESCHAVVIDPDADDGPAALAARPFGSLLILALRPGETAWPGTLALSRPFDERQVDLTLSLAAQIIAQPAFDAQTAPAPPPAANMTTVVDLETVDPEIAAPPEEAPRFAEAVEEAAAIEERQAIAAEAEELQAATQADADADALQAAALESEPDAGTAEGPAAEALALEPVSEDLAGTGDDVDSTPPAAASPFESPAIHDEADDAAIDRLAMAVLEEPAAADELDAEGDALDESIIDLAGSDEPLDLLSFPEVESDPADATSLDHAADVRPEPDFEPLPEPAPVMADRPGPFDDLLPPVRPERVQAAAPPPEPVQELPAPTVALDDVQTLADLATAYREQLYRERHVVIEIDGNVFHLEPYTGECYSESPAASLQVLRGQGDLDVAIDVQESPDGDRPTTPVRLVEFLWQLGYHAGGGRLLPWVDPDARYRITRQPPMDDDAKATGVLQIAQLISRTPVAVGDISRLAGAPESVVHDFLNGCSLLGYLERVAQPMRRRAGGDDASRRAEGNPSLIGNLRRRIGLER